MVGTEAPLLEGVRSAAYGRKEKLGPLRVKKVVPPIGGSISPRGAREKNRPAGGGLRGGFPLFQKELWKNPLLGILDRGLRGVPHKSCAFAGAPWIR